MSSLQLLDLASEIHLTILDNISSTQDKLAFVSTCRKLFYAFENDVTIEQVYRASRRKDGVFALIDKAFIRDRSGRYLLPAFRPITFGDHFRLHNDLLYVKIRLPTLPETADYRKGDLIIEQDAVSIHKPRWLNGTEGTYWLAWNKYCRGKIVRVTGKMVRRTLECPECAEERTVCPAFTCGPGGVADRWPNHAMEECGLKMPCPSCMGAIIAREAIDIYLEEGPKYAVKLLLALQRIV